MESGIALRVLGPVEAWRDTGWAQPTTPQQRLVLGVLALRAGQVVPSRELADAMWDSEPPRSARNSIQVTLTHLRKILTATPAAHVVRCGDGYRLEVDTDAVDVCRFRRLARLARAASDARRTPETSSQGGREGPGSGDSARPRPDQSKPRRAGGTGCEA